MTETRIVGYVMARDEWPLLALSITHALMNHVEHVLVLDHAGGEETRAGLERLARDWPGGVTVVRLEDPDYYQEAATTLMACLGGFASYDWVYVFDADEFLLTPTEHGLGDVLAEVPPDVDVVRYEVHNWVAPSTFDDADLGRYAEIKYRARPNALPDVPGEILADEIEHGNMNYFDAPFESKIIVRGRHSNWIRAGAHELIHPERASEITLPVDQLRAAHLPLLSKSRLLLKCRQGQTLIDSQLPPAHGWQNQMLRRMEQAGQLDDFWAAHSIPSSQVEVSQVTLTAEPDGALAMAITPSVEMLTNQREHHAGVSSAEPTASSYVSTGPAVRAIRIVQEICDAVVAERDAVVAERDAARAQQDAVVAERDAVVAERDAVVAERDAVVAERDAVVAERDVARAQRDAARAQRDEIRASHIWRWTAWYRGLRARLRTDEPSLPSD